MINRSLIMIGFIILISACENKTTKKENKQLLKDNIGQTKECENIALFKELVEKDTSIFENGTLLFWNYSCDSAWLSFINEDKQSILLDKWSEDIEVESRFGLNFLQEYNTCLLFQRNVVSGCCDLPDNILVNKQTGSEIKNIGPKEWYSKNKKYPFVICFNNQESENSELRTKYDRLVIYNLDQNEKYYFPLDNYRFFREMKEGFFNYNQSLLESYQLEGNFLALTFKKESEITKGKFSYQMIKLDLNNFR